MKNANWLWLVGLGVAGYVIYTVTKAPTATGTQAGASAVPAINPSSYDSGGTAAGQAIQNAMNPS